MISKYLSILLVLSIASIVLSTSLNEKLQSASNLKDTASLKDASKNLQAKTSNNLKSSKLKGDYGYGYNNYGYGYDDYYGYDYGYDYGFGYDDYYCDPYDYSCNYYYKRR